MKRIKISNVVRAFNLYLRLKEADDNGYVTCVTCGAIGSYKEFQSGHFQHSLHFIEDNQHSQCIFCNGYNSGSMAKYTLYMIDRYGRDRVEELIRLKKQAHRYSQSELKELRTKFRTKIKELRQQKGLY